MNRTSCLGAFLWVSVAFGSAPGLPTWWKAFTTIPRMEASFVQTSDSAVFGKIQRKGTLRLAKGGRIHVVYEDGLQLVADGRDLIQFDPDTRTAQSMSLRDAAAETPLLRLLTDPSRLDGNFKIEAGEKGEVRIRPLKLGLPEIRIEGGDRLPKRLHWTDASGAGQMLELVGATIPSKEFPSATFTFQPPKGTRWLGQ